LKPAAVGAELIPGVRWRWVDDALWVLDKSAGLSVLADRSGAPSLHDALKAWQEAEARRPRPRIVHRIDKDTSGLLLVALTPEMERILGAAFEARSIGKWYVVQASAPLPGSALRGAERHRITLPLRPGRKGRMRVAGLREAIQHRAQGGAWVHEVPPALAQPEGQSALTVARHLGRQRYIVRLHTGRTHQIRVHFAWLGAPLKGDPRYGRPEDAAQHAPRLGLHCHALLLPEIADGLSRPRRFTSPLPEGFPGDAPAA
jgi:tRNA pseudouridine32 synthase / 23S rRNA pseudouridine746 synthase